MGRFVSRFIGSETSHGGRLIHALIQHYSILSTDDKSCVFVFRGPVAYVGVTVA